MSRHAAHQVAAQYHIVFHQVGGTTSEFCHGVALIFLSGGSRDAFPASFRSQPNFDRSIRLREQSNCIPAWCVAPTYSSKLQYHCLISKRCSWCRCADVVVFKLGRSEYAGQPSSPTFLWWPSIWCSSIPRLRKNCQWNQVRSARSCPHAMVHLQCCWRSWRWWSNTKCKRAFQSLQKFVTLHQQ